MAFALLKRPRSAPPEPGGMVVLGGAMKKARPSAGVSERGDEMLKAKVVSKLVSNAVLS